MKTQEIIYVGVISITAVLGIVSYDIYTQKRQLGAPEAQGGLEKALRQVNQIQKDIEALKIEEQKQTELEFRRYFFGGIK